MTMRPTKTGNTPALEVLVPHQKELRSQPQDPNVSYSDGVPIPDAFDDFSEAYNLNVWIYAAAWAIASNYASLEIKGYRQDPASDMWEEFPDHPWLPLFKRPNPYMSGYTLKEFTSLSLELSGNAYWALERGTDNEVRELWPLPADDVRVVSSKSRMVDHYLFYVNSKPIRYNYDEIIHFSYSNPSSYVYGQGSLSAAKLSVLADLHAKIWNKNFFQNAARPDSVFETDQVLGEDVRKRVLTQWNQMHRGTDKRGKTALLEGGLKYNEINRTPKDVDFVLAQKLAREEILASFGVPPAMVGILEYANYANTKEQTSIFWKHTIMPKKRAIDAIMTMRIQQLSFDPETIFEADATGVEALRVDEFQRSQTMLNYVQMGIPVNQLISAFDLPFEEVEGGDLPRPPATPGFGSAPAPRPETPPRPKEIQPVHRNTKWERHTIQWKHFDRKVASYEERMAVSVRAFFRGQKRRVLAALEANADRIFKPFGKAQGEPFFDINLILKIEQEMKKMRKATDEFISGAYFDFAVATGREAKPGFAFNIGDPRAVDWLEKKQLKLVKEVTDYTQERLTDDVVDSIRDAVAEGLSRGETLKAIVERIDDTYQLANDTRAARIAQTEIISASNAGSFEGLKQLGVEKKEWISSRDDRVRDTHASLEEDDPIDSDQFFISPSGAKLMFPGDPDCGDAGEVINCRCQVVGVDIQGTGL